MIILEILPNPNCEAVEMRVFHEVEPARAVAQVALEKTQGASAWYDVTGWNANGVPTPALAQKVDDSGDGVAYLLYGGDQGLRFRKAGSRAAWSLQDAMQWGESFLIISDINYLKLV